MIGHTNLAKTDNLCAGRLLVLAIVLGTILLCFPKLVSREGAEGVSVVAGIGERVVLPIVKRLVAIETVEVIAHSPPCGFLCGNHGEIGLADNFDPCVGT